MIDMGSTLKLVTDSVVELAVKDGREAGQAFVAAYDLGQNEKVDAIFLEGLETNVSLIIQRLPWAIVIPEFAKDPSIRALLERLNIDPDNIASEVTDELVWAYISAYDQASRDMIRETIRSKKGI